MNTMHLLAAASVDPIKGGADTFFGSIQKPAVLDVYGESGGLIVFTSNAIRLAVIIGGLLALFNIVMAGYTYLTAGGDSKAHEKVMSKLTQSLWGIVIMILAPAFMALIGFLLFKNPSYFLNPTIVGPMDSNAGEGPANNNKAPGTNSGKITL